MLLKAVQVLEKDELLTKELHSQAAAEATLAGSLGTFGFANGSKLARQIEHLFKADKILDKTEIAQLGAKVKALLAEINVPTPEVTTSSNTYEVDERHVLLIVDTFKRITEDLVDKAADSGLQTKIVNSISSARQKLYQEHPNVAVVDAEVLDSDDGLNLLAEFKNRKPAIPTIVLSQEIDNNRENIINKFESTVLKKNFIIRINFRNCNTIN